MFTNPGAGQAAEVRPELEHGVPPWLSDDSHGTEAVLLGCLFLYAALMWMWGVGRLDITSSMEAARALVARNMIRTGDYVVPRIGGEPYLAKPPLFCWGVALASLISGGVTQTTVRVVSSLCAIGVLVVMYLSVRPVLGWVTAFLACAGAATTPIVFGPATAGLVNMMLALAVSISLFGAFYMLESETHSRLYAVACGVGLAIGLLTKGPIVFMFFAPAVLLYEGFRHKGRFAVDRMSCWIYLAAIAALIWLVPVVTLALGKIASILYLIPVGMLLYFGLAGKGARRRGTEWLIVLGVMLLLVAPWPILAVHRLTFDTLWGTLTREVWQARISSIGVSNRGPIWLYFIHFTAAALPYSLLAPVAFFPRHALGTSEPGQRILLLAKCWLLGALVLFTVASPARKLRYIAPVFPALSLLAADVIMRAMREGLTQRMMRYVRRVESLVVLTVCLIPVALVLLWTTTDTILSASAIVSIVLAVTGSALAVYLHFPPSIRGAWLLSLALALLGLKVFINFGRSQIDNREESPRVACQTIRSQVPPRKTLYLHGKTDKSVMFYIDAKPWGRTQLDRGFLHSNSPLFVCMEAANLNSFQSPAGFSSKVIERTESPEGELVLVRLAEVTK